MNKALKFLFITFGSIGAVVATAMTVLAILLASGSVNLNFLKSQFVNNHILKQGNLDFETLCVEWNSRKGLLNFQGRKITLSKCGNNNTNSVVYIKELNLGYDISSLINFEIIPEEIEIDGAQVATNMDFNQDTVAGGDFELNLSDLDEYLEEFVDLRSIIVTNSNFILNSQGQKSVFDIAVDFTKTEFAPNLTINITSRDNKSNANFAVKYDVAKRVVDLDIKVDGFGSKYLVHFLPPALLTHASFDDLAFTGKYRHLLGRKGYAANLTGIVQGIEVDDKNIFSEKLHIPKLSFKGSISNGRLKLQRISSTIKGVPVIAKVDGYINSKGKGSMTTRVDLSNLNMQELEKLWPKGASDPGREWVTENITEGKVPKAYMVMKNKLNLSNTDEWFEFGSISGDIVLEDAVVSYVDTLPKISGVSAIAHFDHEHFDIDIKKGSTHGLEITSGNVYIGNFSEENIDLNLTVNINGSLKNVLSLIDHKPLEYAKKYGLNPNNASGNTRAKLTMRIPLTSPFNASNIQTYVRADIKQAKIKNLVGMDINLDHGTLSIVMDPKLLTIEGGATLNGESAKITLTSDLIKDNLELDIKTVLTKNSLVNLFPEYGLFVKGSVPAQLIYTTGAADSADLKVSLDFKNTDLNLIANYKGRGIPAVLNAHAKYKNGTLRSVENINLTIDKKRSLQGYASFSGKDVQFSNATLSWIKNDSEVLSAKINAKGSNNYFIDVLGKTVDLSPVFLLDFDTVKDKENGKSNIEIKFNAEKIILGGKSGVLNNSAVVRMSNGLVEYLSYNGILEEKQKRPGNKISAEITKGKDGTRKLRIQTNYGGELLRAVDVFGNINGGHLKLVAHNDPQFRENEWVGKIKVQNFSLLDAPAFTKFLAIVFPTGLADLTSEGGMKMQMLKMRFGFSNNVFAIHSCRAFGASLGFSLMGKVASGPEAELNLRGSLTPAYAINTIISKIPLIGQIVTGGKNEGLFAINFEIIGKKHKPNINPNPLTILTPGILRGMFSGEDVIAGLNGDNWMDDDSVTDDVFDLEFNE